MVKYGGLVGGLKLRNAVRIPPAEVGFRQKKSLGTKRRLTLCVWLMTHVTTEGITTQVTPNSNSFIVLTGRTRRLPAFLGRVTFFWQFLYYEDESGGRSHSTPWKPIKESRRRVVLVYHCPLLLMPAGSVGTNKCECTFKFESCVFWLTIYFFPSDPQQDFDWLSTQLT